MPKRFFQIGAGYGRRKRVPAILAGLGYLAAAMTGWAHGPLLEQIAAVSQQLAARPGDVELLLRRAELQRMDENWEAAAQDIAAAGRAGAPAGATSFARARLAVSQGQWEAAAEEVPVFTRELAGHAAAWRAAATIQLQRNDRPAAVLSLRQVIATATPPTMDDYLRLAAELADGGEKAAAVEALDQGIEKLGATAVLMERAGQLEVDLGRTDAALARFERAAKGAGNPAYWQALRAEAAEQGGRRAQAEEIRRAALSLIGEMPEYRRNTAAIADLEERLRSGLVSVHPEAPSGPK